MRDDWPRGMAHRIGLAGAIQFTKSRVALTLHIPCEVGKHTVDFDVKPHQHPDHVAKLMLGKGWTFGHKLASPEHGKRENRKQPRAALESSASVPAIVVPPVVPNDVIEATPDLPAVLMDGDPILRQRSAEVEDFDGDLDTLIKQMLTIVMRRRALGLAAPQIGVLKRVIVAHVDGEFYWMVNPRIMRTLRTHEIDVEGCLSVRQRVAVSRPRKCDLAWQDEHGEGHGATFTGLLARVLLHEIDHLNGVLISDKGARGA